MVSRCGCSGGCSCYVIGGNAMNVVGNGSIAVPYLPQVDWNKPGSLACTRFIHDCGPLIVGDGMQWNDPGDFNQPGTIGIKISSTAGNLAKIGSDGGLWVGAGTSSTLSCTRDVSQLGNGTVFGRGGIGVNSAPQDLIRSIRMALAVGADGVMLNVHMTADQVPVIVPYASFEGNWQYDPCIIAPGQGNAAACGTRYAYLPYPNYLYDAVGLPEWKNLLVNTEDWFVPVVNNTWGANTVMEVLDEMAGKINIAWYLVDTGWYKDSNKQVLRQKMVETIKRSCAEKSSILLVNNYTYLADFAGSGIDTGVYLENAIDMANSTAARVTAAGGKWAFLNYQLKDNAEFVKYQQAGLKTLATQATRRSQITEMAGAPYNLMGVVSDDVTYSANKVKVGGTRDFWGLGTVPPGQFHEAMDYDQYRPRLRGTPYHEMWTMPIMEITETVRQLTLGWATPLPSAALTPNNNLLIQWEQCFQPDDPIVPANDPCFSPTKPGGAGLGSLLGIAICMDTDRPATDVKTQLTPARTYEPPTSYTCLQGSNGTLNITGRYNGAGTTPSSFVSVGDPGGATSGAGQWRLMQIIVTPTKVVFRRMAASGEGMRVEMANNEAAAMRTNFANRYLALRKEKTAGVSDFYGSFRSLTISTTSLS